MMCRPCISKLKKAIEDFDQFHKDLILSDPGSCAHDPCNVLNPDQVGEPG